MKYKLPEGWKEERLSKHIKIISGGTPKRAISNYWGNEIPWISIQDIKNINGRYVRETVEGITKEGYENSSTNILKKDDIIISARGTVGELGLISIPMAFNQSCYGIRSEKTIDSIFLFYFLKNNIKSVQSKGHGSVFNTITRDTFNTIVVQIPPLKEQEAIANTLSALDDKLENNNKIAKNLEEQAQAIFKHWFVDFEFPNEEGKPYKSSGGEMEESELGMIPKGWEVGKLGDSKLGKLMSSGIDNFKGEKIYLATADVTGTNITNNDTVVTMDSRPSRANMQPKNNTVWFAKMKDSRKLIFVEKNDNILKDKYIFSTGFAGIQGSETSIYYLWTYIQSDKFDSIKNNLCTGTTMQAINNRNINRIKLVIPDSKILEKFNLIVKPLYKKIIVSRNENQKLEELRDTLLPKLISGELRIPLD